MAQGLRGRFRRARADPALGPAPSRELAARCGTLPASPVFVRSALHTHPAAIARPKPGAKSKRRPTRKRKHRRFSSKQTLLGRLGRPARAGRSPLGPRAAHLPQPGAWPAPPSLLLRLPPPWCPGPRGPLTGSQGGGCSGDAPLPSAAPARGGVFCGCSTAKGGSRATPSGGRRAGVGRAAPRLRGPGIAASGTRAPSRRCRYPAGRWRAPRALAPPGLNFPGLPTAPGRHLPEGGSWHAWAPPASLLPAHPAPGWTLPGRSRWPEASFAAGRDLGLHVGLACAGSERQS